MATVRQANAFRAANDKIDQMVQAQMQGLWRRIRGSEPAVIRDAFLELAPSIVEKFGPSYAAAAAEYFEGLIGSRAVLAELDLAEAVAGSIRYKAGKLWTPNADDALAGFTATVTRHSRQWGRSTIAESSRRTRGTSYARRPEPGACAWCLMLSSRGAVYASKELAGGEGNDYHDKCRCDPEPVHNDLQLSYNVDELYAMYSAQHSSGDTGAEVAAKMRAAYELS